MGTVRRLHKSPRRTSPGGVLSIILAVIAVLAATPLCAAEPPARPEYDRGASVPPRIVAIGDIHGDFDNFVAVLRRAGLVDERLTWTGATTTLVQTGDFTDRGAKVRQVIDLLIDLERQAAHAAGEVIVLLGNHEVMNLMRDVRDVAPEAYRAFVDEHSGVRQARAYREYVHFIASRGAAGVRLPLRRRDEWLRSHPPGYIEYSEAFDADGVYGRWLRSRRSVVTLGDTAFLHAGINPDRAPRTLEDVNQRIRTDIQRFDEFRRHLIRQRLILPSFTLQEIFEVAVAELTARNARSTRNADPMWAGDAFDRRDEEVLAAVLEMGTWDTLRPDGPLWFRGFATWPREEGQVLVRKLSARYGVAHWVVGHTTTMTMRVTSRFGSSVFLIDTGMSSTENGARPSALEIRDGRFTAVSLDEDTTLTVDDRPPVGRLTPSR